MIRSLCAVSVVTVGLTSLLAIETRSYAAEPGRQTPAIDPTCFAGKWIRAPGLDEQLGYESDWPGEEIEIKIDARFGERWDANQKTDFEAAVARMNHKSIASGTFAMPKLHGHPWEAVVTHSKGSTYITFYLPQVGGAPHRILYVRGRTSDRDLLLIEVEVGTEPEDRTASAYKRKHPAKQAAPE